MLNHLLTDKEEASSNRDIRLTKTGKNIMNETRDLKLMRQGGKKP